eukprot:TRINITY_DN618_c0_g1_i6.p1 TRINITY_DN618_c0_g1~~TRINITY_DN618_c0_g1_i6.p1  ORF type:complete len:623 (-),score=60.06 TRINITY_DN618_c0_g1_i6:1-1869(-)
MEVESKSQEQEGDMEGCKCPQGNSQIKDHTEKCKLNPGWGLLFNDPDTASFKDRLIKDGFRVGTVLAFTDEDMRSSGKEYGIERGVVELIIQNLRRSRTTTQAPTNQDILERKVKALEAKVKELQYFSMTTKETSKLFELLQRNGGAELVSISEQFPFDKRVGSYKTFEGRRWNTFSDFVRSWEKAKSEDDLQKSVVDFFDEWKCEGLRMKDTHSTGLLQPKMKPDCSLIDKNEKSRGRLLWSMLCAIIELKLDITNYADVVGQIITRHYQVLDRQQFGRVFMTSAALSKEHFLFVHTVNQGAGYKHYFTNPASLTNRTDAVRLINFLDSKPEDLGFKVTSYPIPNIKQKVKCSNILKRSGSNMVTKIETKEGEYVLKQGAVEKEMKTLDDLKTSGVLSVTGILERGKDWDWFLTKFYGDPIDAWEDLEDIFDNVKATAVLLETIHTKVKIIHGDIKPSNIVSDGDDPVIIDWGSSRVIGSTGSLEATLSFLPLRYQQGVDMEAKCRDDFESLFYSLLSMLYEAGASSYPLKPGRSFEETCYIVLAENDLIADIRERRKMKGSEALTKEKEGVIRRIHQTLFKNGDFETEVTSITTCWGPTVYTKPKHKESPYKNQLSLTGG